MINDKHRRIHNSRLMAIASLMAWAGGLHLVPDILDPKPIKKIQTQDDLDRIQAAQAKRERKAQRTKLASIG